jgi:hypothetical protein
MAHCFLIPGPVIYIILYADNNITIGRGTDMDEFPFGDSSGITDKLRSAAMDMIKKSDPSSSREAAVGQEGKKHESGGGDNKGKGDEAGGHFESLKKSADLINEELEMKGSRYRFYIYKESEDIFINLVRLGVNGEVVEVNKKNITHQEFAELIKRLENGEGFIIDSSG